jgi:ABC-type uncharacterized transport system ATPase subunit
VLTHDFDRIQYRIRAIDFDQQCYEGNIKVYKPQFLKENNALVEMTLRYLQETSIEQYKSEERALLAKRATSEKDRLKEMMDCMVIDTISSKEKIKQLKTELFELTGDLNFKRSSNMGEILNSALDFIVRNYQNENPYLVT